MPQPTPLCEHPIAQFQQFRHQLYELFPKSRDSLMDLLDALSGNTMGTSPVELCEHPLFRRGYSSLYKAIVQLFQSSKPERAGEERNLFQQSLLKALAPLIPEPTQSLVSFIWLGCHSHATPFC